MRELGAGGEKLLLRGKKEFINPFFHEFSYLILEDLEKNATMSGKKGSKHEGFYSHELYKDVERWA